jgi:signal transduction histidine kinase
VRSLRGRLTLGVTIVLATVLAIAGAIASHEVRTSESAAFDDRLQRTAELSRPAALAAIQEQLPTDDRRLDNVLDATRSSLRLVVGTNPVLVAGIDPPAHARLPAGLHTFSAGGVDYRVYVTTLNDKALGGLARLEVLSSLQALQDRQTRLDRRMAALGLLAILASALGVWLAADIVLRPLQRLRAVASSIADDEDLDRRVPASDGPAELNSLAASFNAMLGRLGRSARDRELALAATRRFAANAGHELRTPLTSVQTTLTSLARHPELSKTRRTAMAEDALGEQRRLVALLDGLQALARGDAGPLERGDTDLVELVDEVVTAAAVRYPKAHFDVELPDAPVVVSAWPPGLRLLVENLVANAALHGQPETGAGRVLVTLDRAARLCIDDNGPGIPSKERQRIFEAFERTEGTTAPGSGLGLALAAQQARHLDTQIEVSDSPLGGARFSVALTAH